MQCKLVAEGFAGTPFIFYFLFARPCTRMLMRYVFALLAVVTHIPSTEALCDRTSIGTSAAAGVAGEIKRIGSETMDD